MSNMVKVTSPGQIAVLVGGIVLLVGLGVFAMLDRSVKEQAMTAEADVPIVQGEGGNIPPIDAAAPVDTKTATFALG